MVRKNTRSLHGYCSTEEMKRWEVNGILIGLCVKRFIILIVKMHNEKIKK